MVRMVTAVTLGDNPAGACINGPAAGYRRDRTGLPEEAEMTTWPADDDLEADPADVAEQHTLADVADDADDDAADGAEAVQAIVDVREADPADVYEQAIPVGSGDDGWDRG